MNQNFFNPTLQSFTHSLQSQEQALHQQPHQHEDYFDQILFNQQVQNTPVFDPSYQIISRISSNQNAQNNRKSTAIKILEDREKFLLAKINFDLESLLELMMSNDTINVANQNNTRSSKGFRNINIFEIGESQKRERPIHDYRSDLRLKWMKVEQRVSHSSINQISYFILERKIRLENMNVEDEKSQELTDEINAMINQICDYFEKTDLFRKRLQKFLLMGDEAGVQATLYLLFLICDVLLNHKVQLKSGFNNSILASVKDHLINLSIMTNKSKNLKSNKHNWVQRNIHGFLELCDQILNDSNMKIDTKRLVIGLLDLFSDIDAKETKKSIVKNDWFRQIQFIFQEDFALSLEEGQELVYSLQKIFTKEQVRKILANQTISKKNHLQDLVANDLGSQDNYSTKDVQVELEQSLHFHNYQEYLRGKRRKFSNMNNQLAQVSESNYGEGSSIQGDYSNLNSKMKQFGNDDSPHHLSPKIKHLALSQLSPGNRARILSNDNQIKEDQDIQQENSNFDQSQGFETSFQFKESQLIQQRDSEYGTVFQGQKIMRKLTHELLAQESGITARFQQQSVDEEKLPNIVISKNDTRRLNDPLKYSNMDLRNQDNDSLLLAQAQQKSQQRGIRKYQMERQNITSQDILLQNNASCCSVFSRKQKLPDQESSSQYNKNSQCQIF